MKQSWASWNWRKMLMVAGDALFVTCAVSWLHSELTGGVRVDLGLLTFSNRSTERALFQAISVLTIRQIVLPGPGVVSTAAKLWRYLAENRATGHAGAIAWLDGMRPVPLVLAIVLITRATVLAVGVLATLSATPSGDAARDNSLERSQSAPIEYLHGRWDAGWYASIAVNGYVWNADTPGVQQNVAFFPAFPIVVRLAMRATEPIVNAIGAPDAFGREPGVRAENIGCIISILCFFGALLLLGRIAELEIGRALSNRAIVLAGVAPFSFFFSAAYTESLLLLSVLGAFHFLRHGRFGWWIICGLIAGLTKQTGFLLSIPLGIYAMSLRSQVSAPSRDDWRHLAGVLAPTAGACLYSGYLWWAFGDPIAWVRAQGAWHTSDRWIHLSHARSVLEFGTLYPYEAVNLLSVLVSAPLIWQSRRLHWSYFAFGALAVSVPLVVGVVPLARMLVPVFPL